MILPSKYTPITITTADPTGIRLDEIFLRLPSGAVDVVWTGAAYVAPYLSSARTEVTPDQEFSHVLARTGGWPTSFELFVRVVDIDGNASEATYPYTLRATPVTAPASAIDPRRVGSGLTDADGQPTGQITDYEQRAHDRLIQYFQGKPRLRALLGSYADQAQELEAVFWYLYTKRGISNAAGVWLDVLGEIVGEPRQDRTDDGYRSAIRVRILVNRSDGKHAQLVTIAERMLGDGADVQITESFPVALVVRVYSDMGAVLPTDLVRMLRQAKAGGVRLDLVYATNADRTFRWGSTPTSAGATPAAAHTTGWGSTTDAALGGLWAAVL